VTNWLVSDASVSLLWVKQSDEDPILVRGAWKLRRDITAGKFRVLLPFHWHLEIANALRRFVAAKRLTLPEAQRAMRLLLRFAHQHGFFLQPPTDWSELVRRADAWSVSLYDAIYLDLAARTGAILWTADIRLYRQWYQRPNLRWLGVGWIGYYPQTGIPLVPP
jgi:predicted nucleic acid-binding protein